MENSGIILTLNGKDFELNMKYRNMKFLYNKFHIKLSSIDSLEDDLGKVIYAAMKPKNSLPDLKFEELESLLDEAENLEYLFNIVSDLMKKAFPKGSEEDLKNKSEKKSNGLKS